MGPRARINNSSSSSKAERERNPIRFGCERTGFFEIDNQPNRKKEKAPGPGNQGQRVRHDPVKTNHSIAILAIWFPVHCVHCVPSLALSLVDSSGFTRDIRKTGSERFISSSNRREYSPNHWWLHDSVAMIARGVQVGDREFTMVLMMMMPCNGLPGP